MNKLQLPAPAEPPTPGTELIRQSPAGWDQSPATVVDVSPKTHTGGSEYLSILRRRKWLIAFVSLAGAVCGLAFSMKQTPAYEAKASIELIGPADDPINLSGPRSSSDSRFSVTSQSYLLTQIEILSSDSLIRRVIERLREQKLFREPQPQPAKWAEWFGSEEKAPEPPARESIVQEVKKRLTVSTVPGSTIVQVAYDSPDPGYSALLANTIVEEFIDWDSESRVTSSHRTSKWLAEQMEDLQSRLRQSETQLQKYAEASGLLITSDRENIAEGKLRRIEEQFSSAQADRVVQQSRIEMARAVNHESLPEIRDSATLSTYRVELNNLKREAAELLAILTPEHYKVKQVQAKIHELVKAIKREEKAILGRLQTDYERANRHESLLREAYLRQAREVSDQAGKTVQYNLLKQEVETNRIIYEKVLEKVKEARIASALETTPFRVVDPATPPVKPYKPNVPMTVALGAFTGLFMSLAFVFIQDFSDSRIRRPGETTSYLRVPELGVIPRERSFAMLKPQFSRIKVKLQFGKRRQQGDEAGDEYDAEAPENHGPLGGAADPIELAAWNRQSSMIAESFRSSVTSVLLTPTNAGRPRIITITSPMPGEGKSTVACNMAIALARIHPSVLLIDGDLRRPRLDQILGVPAHRGLKHLLKEPQPLLNEPIESLVRASSIPGLYVLPSGPEEEDWSSLLYSPRLPELLLKARREFHTILIDTAPMLQLSDARLFGRLSDGVVLVLRSGKTSREEAKAARQRFLEDGTPVLGTILNDWNPQASDSRIYQKYAGYYQRKAGA